MDYDALTKPLQEIDKWPSGASGRLLADISAAQKYVRLSSGNHKWAQKLRFLVDARENGKNGDYEFELITDDIDSSEKYIAVSYCSQSSTKSGKTKEAGQIRIRVNTPEGTIIRNARARPDVLTRSFNFAKAYGIRKIWIDQECVEHDDGIDKENAIHCMDLVYRRAGVTLVLLSSRIETIQEAKIVEEWVIPSSEESKWILDANSPRSLLQRKFISDQWFTRAWTTQEFLASAEYAVKFVVGWDEDGDEEVGGFMEGLQARTCELDRKGELPWDQDVQKVSGEWVLLLRQVQGMALIATSNAHGHHCVESGTEVSSELRAAAALMEELNSEKHAREDVFTLSEVDISELELELSDYSSRPRLSDIPEETYLQTPTIKHNPTPTIRPSPDSPTFNSYIVTALSTLRDKSNTRAADKLAILGNLIGYEWRIDTTAAERQELSVSACAISLALYNGDTSLLFAYVNPNNDTKYQINTTIPRWLPSENLSLQQLQETESNSHIKRTKPKGGRKCLVVNDSLLIEGLLWSISPFQDLFFLAEKMGILLDNVKDPADHQGGSETVHDVYRSCLQLLVRELFYLNRKDLVELLIVHCLRPHFSSPAEIFVKLVELEEWVRGTREWPEHHALEGWDAYDGERLLWLYQTIAAGKPLALGICDIGEDVIMALFHTDPQTVTAVLTVLSDLEYEFSSQALVEARYIFANPRRQYSWTVEVVEEDAGENVIEEATDVLVKHQGEGSEEMDRRELFISRLRLRVTGYAEGTWSLRLSSSGIVVPVPECNCWRMVTLGKEAAYYLVQ
ncbi:hypothetical protein RUND412_008736 [Rhizina undulata]